MLDFIIYKNNLVGLIAAGFKFQEFVLDGLQDKHAVAAWNLATIASFP